MFVEIFRYLGKDGNRSTEVTHFSAELNDHVSNQVAHRSLMSCWIETAFIAAAIWATPIERHFETPALIFSSVLLSLMVLQIGCYTLFNGRFKDVTIPIRIISLSVWGTFGAFFLSKFGISWTSFFFLLSSLGLATAQIAVFSPKMKWLLISHSVVAAPLIAVHAFVIKGLNGSALALLLFGFSVLLVSLGKKLNVEFWVQSIDQARLKAILDAIPGAISWYDLKKNQLGSNKLYNNLFGENSGEFKNIVSKLFDNGEAEINKSLEVDNKLFYFVGKKYNFDSEAVFMGIDLSKEQFWQTKLEKERSQYLKSARLIAEGELIEAFQHTDGATIKEISKILSNQDQKVNSKQIVDLLNKTYSDFAKSKNSIFNTKVADELLEHTVHSDVLLALTILIQNAFDAIDSADNQAVQLSAQKDGDHLQFVVTDSGDGIEEFYEDLVFEPLFTTKDDTGSGTGLSLATEMVNDMGGSITYKKVAAGSCFLISIPCHSESIAS